MFGKFGSAAEEMEAFVREQKRVAALKAASQPPSDKKKSKKEAKKEKKAAVQKKQPPQTSTTDVASTSDKDSKGSEKRLSKRLSTKLFKKKNSVCQKQESGSSKTGGNPQSDSTMEERSEEELAMDKMRKIIDRQETRETDLRDKMKNLIVEAKKKLSNGDKKGALLAMKRKKFFEDELDKLQNAKYTMETQILTIESAIENREMFKAMAIGSNSMKKLQSDVGIDEVDTIMENIREEMESALEINGALVQDVDPSAFDDDALLAELMSMDRSNSLDADEEVATAMPEAPITSIEPKCHTPDPHSEKKMQPA